MPWQEPTPASAEPDSCGDALDAGRRAHPHRLSSLEELMLALCDEHGLAAPRANSHGRRPPGRLPLRRQRLVVETDCWRYHRTRRAFERDRERDAILARAGYRTLRFTHRQLTSDPAAVMRPRRPATDRIRSSA